MHNIKLYFAPMESITTYAYRKAIMEMYPEWNFFVTDFLRLPSVGDLTDRRIIEHIGEKIFHNQQLLNATYFQVLTTAKVNNKKMSKQIDSLKIPYLNLNIGCPSKKVNAHGGGAYLLKDHNMLRQIISDIRDNYSGHFSLKIRSGFNDNNDFIRLIKLLNSCDVDQLIIHARTRAQFYKTPADWRLFDIADQYFQKDLVFNGDIYSVEDVKVLHQKFPQRGLMCARGALKSPWLIRELISPISFSEKRNQTIKYFTNIAQSYSNLSVNDDNILKKLKALANYIIKEDLERKSLLRSKTLKDFFTIVYKTD